MTQMNIQVPSSYPVFIDQGVASCATADPDAFFPERGSHSFSNVYAKRICSTCPYKSPCLEWAIENEEMGIWGGTTENERRSMRRMRKKSSR